MDIVEHNRIAWNQESQKGNEWTIPVKKEVLGAARQGEAKIVLTPYKAVPQGWLGEIRGKAVLCLASGGGQQGPVLAAAGARVTVFDNSEEQLRADRKLSDEHGLGIETVQGNMQDLSCFPDQVFDLIIHPVSNCFIDDIHPVWAECYRVLKDNGALLSGFCSPLVYMVDWEAAEKTGRCELKYPIPYSDVDSLSPAARQAYIRDKIPFEFGHSLSDQIQGQIGVGFLIAGFYEDKGDEHLDQFTDSYIATRAIKPGRQ
jgi:SAM-dependent methyltransferase